MTNPKLISDAKTMATYLSPKGENIVTELVDALEAARCEIWHLEAQLTQIRDEKLRVVYNLGVNEHTETWRNGDGEFYRYDPYTFEWTTRTYNGKWVRSLHQPPRMGPYTEVIDYELNS